VGRSVQVARRRAVAAKTSASSTRPCRRTSSKAQENPYAIIDVGRLYEVQKYLSVTNHMWSAYHFLGNRGRLEGAAARHPSRRRAEPRQVRRCCSAATRNCATTRSPTSSLRGLAFNHADTSGFRTRLSSSGFYARWKDKFGPQLGAVGKDVRKLA